MSKTELTTSFFRIKNLAELSRQFELFEVRGLDRDHEGYFRNRSKLEFELRRATRSPACVVESNSGLLAAIAGDGTNVPQQVNLVRSSVRLKSINQTREAEFTSDKPNQIALCLNILHFHFQGALSRDGKLWQPGSGRPMFFKEPCSTSNNLNLFRGFALRPFLLPDNTIGIAVDIKHSFVHRNPLASNLTRNEFKNWKGKRFVYHYGENWYEIKLASYLGVSISEMDVSTGNGRVESLHDLILRCCRKPHPKELAELSGDEMAVAYFNAGGDQKTVPASLCYPIETSQHPEVKKFERQIKLDPTQRLSEVSKLVENFLASTSHNGMTVKIEKDPVRIPRKMFCIPDLVFGNETVLTTDHTADCLHVSLPDWGKEKKRLLLDRNVGFIDQAPLGTQYLVLPQSVANSYGESYKLEIAKAVDKWFPQEHGYAPTIIEYDDRSTTATIELGGRVTDAIDAANPSEGCALVVVPRLSRVRKGEEDELTALVVRELFDRGLTAAVSHTEVPNECFVENRSRNQGLRYVIANGKQGKWKGYALGLALNKVLLTNERWPFALSRRLVADLTIGIDVKNNTAGFVLMGPQGRIVRMNCSASRQKERLAQDQIAAGLYDLISLEASHLEQGLANILIMRDGRLFEQEQRGIHDAMKRLVDEGLVDPIATATLVEVHKTSAVPVRLFDQIESNGRASARNPMIGDCVICGNDGFLSTTGYPFKRPGTSKPLHIKFLEGRMEFEDCLEDLFSLSCLSFTRPDDCSTVPVNLRLLDRRLREEGSDYDSDALRYRSTLSVRSTA